jgi:hypothetical protein
VTTKSPDVSTLPIVERVAPIVARALAKRHGLGEHMPVDAWMKEAVVATRTALEASHHAELVEVLSRIKYKLDGYADIDGAIALIDALLAKVGAAQ